MGQLIRATMIPLKTIHFSQPGRLVSSDSIDMERRKAIARHNAMRMNHAAVGGNDYRYIQQINRAFSHKRTSLPLTEQQTTSASAPSSNHGTYSSVPAVTGEEAPTAENGSYYQAPVTTGGISESQAAYTVQRGSFELRVAKGELSYLPPLDMTIIVQYPGVEFEYLGDFNYIPPREETNGETINLNI